MNRPPLRPLAGLALAIALCASAHAAEPAPGPLPRFMFDTPLGWPGGVVRYYYDASHEPRWWGGRGLERFQTALGRWTQACGVRFVHAGDARDAERDRGRHALVTFVPGQRKVGVTTLSSAFGLGIVRGRIAFSPAMQAPDATMTHEIGHLLGLSHSPVEGAVMAGPPGAAYNTSLALADDDVVGCRALYDRPPLEACAGDAACRDRVARVPSGAVRTATGDDAITPVTFAPFGIANR